MTNSEPGLAPNDHLTKVEASLKITSVRFRNYKAFASYSVTLGPMNLLVGPNNSGKSTILSAFRLLAAGIRRARARRPDHLVGPGGVTRRGYTVATSGGTELSISLENVHTDYADTDTTVDFRFSSGRSLSLHFPPDGSCLMFPDTDGRTPDSPSSFKTHFPFTIGLVPVLGPVECREPLLLEESVRAALETHRASRHFRNYWRFAGDEFGKFASLLARTWPGVTIEQPEVVYTATPPFVTMFCREQRMTRELYWAGFGFQVWCQLLTHLCRASADSLLIVDEPEIYLHPDLQRQLLSLLRSSGPDVLLATHSTEMVSDADPGELVLIDRTRSAARRLSADTDVQEALDAIGSTRNVLLTQLARHRRVVFVEGNDLAILRRFARKLGLVELANGVNVTFVPIGGFSNWEKLKALSWGLERILGDDHLRMGLLLDRDYRADGEIDAVVAELTPHLEFVHVLRRKELENYLLVPAVLDRAVATARAERTRRTGNAVPAVGPAATVLMEATRGLHDELFGQYLARRTQAERGRTDLATIATEMTRWFERRWANLTDRLEIVPGKRALSLLNEQLQQTAQISLTTTRIVDALRQGEISEELVGLFDRIERFRQQ